MKSLCYSALIHSIIATYQGGQSEKKAQPWADTISIQVAACIYFCFPVSTQVAYLWEFADVTVYCVLTFTSKACSDHFGRAIA